MKKYTILTVLSMFFSLFLWGAVSLETHAEQYYVTDTNWYLNAVDEANVITAPSVLTEYDSLTITLSGTPSDEVMQSLENLSGEISSCHISTYADEITIGKEESPLHVASFNVDMQGDIVANLNADNFQISNGYYGVLQLKGNVTNCSLYASNVGTLQISGDVQTLNLGEAEGYYKYGIGGSIVVNGKVSTINWYRKADSHSEKCVYYMGDISVSGVVEKSNIYEYVHDDVAGLYTYQVVGTVENCPENKFVITSGILSNEVSVTEITPSFGPYTYKYVYFYDDYFSGEDSWTKEYYDDQNVFVGSKECTLADIPEGAHVSVGTATKEPIIINCNLRQLDASGEVTVNGDVDILNVWGADFIDVTVNGNVLKAYYVGTGTDLYITGNVDKIEVMNFAKPGDSSNLTIDGSVLEGTHTEYNWQEHIYIYKYFTCNNTWLIKDGVWNPGIMLKTKKDDTGIGVEAIDRDKLNDAIGDSSIGQETTVQDADGNDITIVKTADASITETADNTLSAIEEQQSFLDLLIKIVEKLVEEVAEAGKQFEAESVCAVDINLATYYKNQADDSVYEETGYEPANVTELPEGKELEFTVQVPVAYYDDDAKYQVVREHNGQYEALDTTQNGDKLTFKSDKFSTFVIVEVVEKQTTGQPTQPNQPNQPTTPTQTVTPNQSSQSVTNSPAEKVEVTYTVVRGDSLSRIARKYGVSLKEILALNPAIKNPNLIYVGQRIVITQVEGTEEQSVSATQNYVVKKGDSLYRIARKNGLTMLELRRLNPELFAQKYIYAGQTVRIK